MKNKLLIDASLEEEIIIGLVSHKNELLEYLIEDSQKSLVGNIYLGKIEWIEPSLQAAFVNFGEEKNGFLSIDDIHPSYHLLKSMNQKASKIQNLIRKGQEIIVQITRDATGKKTFNLTSYISLNGVSCVLLPNNKSGHGISRKIKAAERKKIKDFLEKLPKEDSLIIRTAATNVKIEEIEKDYKRLKTIWSKIKIASRRSLKNRLLYKEEDPLVRALRSYSINNISEVIIEGEQTFKKILGLKIKGKLNFPSKIEKNKKDDIFEEIKDQIEKIYKPEVKLPSGGSIVIHQTEALVAIDVNSKYSTKEKSIENTALKSNMEAAQEIAKNIILRDLGGLIVIDFIDMEDKENIEKVEKAIKLGFKEDKASITFGKISKFGLLEISRQRIRSSLLSRNFSQCKTCTGSGFVIQDRKNALNLMRKIKKHIEKKEELVISVTPTIMEEMHNNIKESFLEIFNYPNISWNIKEGETEIFLKEK